MNLDSNDTGYDNEDEFARARWLPLCLHTGCSALSSLNLRVERDAQHS